MTFTCFDWNRILLLHWFFFSAAGREIARLHIAWPNFFIYSITNIYTSVVASASQCSFFLRIPRATGGSLLERAWLHMGWMFVTKRGMVEWNWKYGRHTPSWSAEGIHRPVRICHDLWKVSEFGWMDVLDFMSWIMFLWKLTVLLVGIKQGQWQHSYMYSKTIPDRPLH